MQLNLCLSVCGEPQFPGTSPLTDDRPGERSAGRGGGMPRMSSVKLTKRVVCEPAIERGDRVFYDRDLTGFGVRVYASGRKVFVVHARAPGLG